MEGYPKFRYLLVPLCLAGCSHAPEAPYPNWLTASESSAVEPRASDALLEAALEAERRAGPDLHRVAFTPGRAEVLMKRLAGCADSAVAAVRQGGLPQARSTAPFQSLPGQTGWRLIGRTLVWRIEAAGARESGSDAVEPFLGAVRFGLALTAGSAADASLGFSIVEEAGRALNPTLGLMNAADLRRLGTGVEALLNARPNPDRLLEHERASMRAAVQYVQDAYRRHNLDRLHQELGRDIEPALQALEKLRGEPSSKRTAYFEGMAQESDRWLARFRAEFSLNASQRSKQPKFELGEGRPWRRFSPHFFAALEPLPAARDRAIARLRLIGLPALLRAECRTNGTAPSSLTGISKHLTIDPYSGHPLIYQPEGREFRLYSVGPDLKDDGGDPVSDLSPS